MLRSLEQLKEKCRAIDIEINELALISRAHVSPAVLEHRIQSLKQLWDDLNHDKRLEELIQASRDAGC